MRGVCLDDAGLKGIGEDASEQTDGPRGGADASPHIGFAAQLLGLDADARVLPAMMSFKTLLTSALTRSFTRRVPMSGTI